MLEQLERYPARQPLWSGGDMVEHTPEKVPEFNPLGSHLLRPALDSQRRPVRLDARPRAQRQRVEHRQLRRNRAQERRCSRSVHIPLGQVSHPVHKARDEPLLTLEEQPRPDAGI